MRAFIVGFYLIGLFVFTCTYSLTQLLSDWVLTFHFNPYPDVSSFFHNDLVYAKDPTYVMQKVGHFIYFFLLAVLVFWAWKRLGLVLLISFAAALSTEVAQLYFSRSGRFLDVGYDLAGMMLFFSLYGCYQLLSRVSGGIPIRKVNK